MTGRRGELEYRIERAWMRMLDLEQRQRAMSQAARERTGLLSGGYTDTIDPDWTPDFGPPFEDNRFFFKVVDPYGVALSSWAYQVRQGFSPGSTPYAVFTTGTTNGDGIGSFIGITGASYHRVQSAGLSYVQGTGSYASQYFTAVRGAADGLYLDGAITTSPTTFTAGADQFHTYAMTGRLLWFEGGTVSDRWGTGSILDWYNNPGLGIPDDLPEYRWNVARTTASGYVGHATYGASLSGSFYIYYRAYISGGQVALMGSFNTAVTSDRGQIPLISSEDTGFRTRDPIEAGASADYPTGSRPDSVTVTIEIGELDPDFATLAYQGGSRDVTFTEG